jgi:alpha-beta hydrolase superfamily lysophospholipase
MMAARAHGNSGGSQSTYAKFEIFDMQVIVNSLEATEKTGHLFALGESMGAAVSLQSAALARKLDGVVAEGAFRSLREVPLPVLDPALAGSASTDLKPGGGGATD